MYFYAHTVSFAGERGGEENEAENSRNKFLRGWKILITHFRTMKNSFKNKVSLDLITQIHGTAFFAHGLFSIVYTHITLGN